MCWRCWDGGIVTCVDDMCRGAGECMHGDGMMPCPECHGGDDDPDDDYPPDECPTCGEVLNGRFPLCNRCQMVEALKRGNEEKETR